MLSQVLPLSINSLIPTIIEILYNTLTIWISATIVARKASLQGALIFSVISYFILILLSFLPIPSLPFISTVIVAEIAIKSLLAMKLFDTDFRQGLSIGGVQMILRLVLRLPF